MFSVGAKDKTWMPMMRLQAEQWTLWFPSARRGQGVLYFYRLRIDAVMAECESTLLGARMGGSHGKHPGISLRAMSGRGVGHTGRWQPRRSARMDAAGALLRPSALAP